MSKLLIDQYKQIFNTLRKGVTKYGPAPVERFVKILNMTISLSVSPARLMPLSIAPDMRSDTANTTNRRHGLFTL